MNSKVDLVDTDTHEEMNLRLVFPQDADSMMFDAERDAELRYRFHQGPENGSTLPEDKLKGRWS